VALVERSFVLRRVAQALRASGVLGFCCAGGLRIAGPWADRIEKPVFFEATTIALPTEAA
jgi:hypothetical protein